MASKKKTNEWIEGYVFGRIERHIIEALMHGDKELRTAVSVPKVWFGLREYRSKDNTLADEQISEFQCDLNKTLCNYNTNKTIYDYTINIFPDESYMRFVVEGVRREPVKEMTIAEIEKELGYKIKVVGDKT